MKEAEIKGAVRKGYAKIAKQRGSFCGPQNTCGSTDLEKIAGKRIGYSDEELETTPEGSNLGLGCGNPVALASLRENEIVLDLGSGAGFDCFIAAKRVGDRGRVIGVDMTPEMIEKARENAEKGNCKNVEFRLGEIENLPVADASVDVVISNCVINLVPDKRRVFREAYRALRPGGRLMIADIVLLKELPESIRSSIEAYIGCLSGAVSRDEYLHAIRDAGFQNVKIVEEKSFPVESIVDSPSAKAIIEELNIPQEEVGEVACSVVSINVSGIKPIPRHNRSSRA